MTEIPSKRSSLWLKFLEEVVAMLEIPQEGGRYGWRHEAEPLNEVFKNKTITIFEITERTGDSGLSACGA